MTELAFFDGLLEGFEIVSSARPFGRNADFNVVAFFFAILDRMMDVAGNCKMGLPDFRDDLVAAKPVFETDKSLEMRSSRRSNFFSIDKILNFILESCDPINILCCKVIEGEAPVFRTGHLRGRGVVCENVVDFFTGREC